MLSLVYKLGMEGANSSSALARGHISGCCKENLFYEGFATFWHLFCAATKFFSIGILTPYWLTDWSQTWSPVINVVITAGSSPLFALACDGV